MEVTNTLGLLRHGTTYDRKKITVQAPAVNMVSFCKIDDETKETMSMIYKIVYNCNLFYSCIRHWQPLPILVNDAKSGVSWGVRLR
jgi:hypothetical protein